MCTVIGVFFAFCGYIDIFSLAHLYCIVGCLSMIVSTHAVLGVLYACFTFLYLHLFSPVEHVSHGKAL